MEHGSCFNNFVCRDYKTSQRGNGAGGVHSRHNAHHLYPKNMTEFVKQPPDTPKESVMENLK